MVGREGVDRRGRGGGKGQTGNRKERSLTAGEGEGQKKPQPRAGSSLHNRISCNARDFLIRLVAKAMEGKWGSQRIVEQRRTHFLGWDKHVGNEEL
jgi:hypothetical protein